LHQHIRTFARGGAGLAIFGQLPSTVKEESISFLKKRTKKLLTV
jgi:hypothetical protein